jgi:hypothetical protein
LPQWLSDNVYKQWGAPNSAERFNKLRNTLNVALGSQKGRSNPSAQAINKREKDILFMDSELKQNLDLSWEFRVLPLQKKVLCRLCGSVTSEKNHLFYCQSEVCSVVHWDKSAIKKFKQNLRRILNLKGIF